MDWLPILNTFIQFSLSTLIWVFFLVWILWIYKDQFKNILNSFVSIWGKATKVELFGVNVHLGRDVPLVGQEGQSMNYREYQNPLVKNEAEVIRKQLTDENLSQEQAINLLIRELANSHFHVVMNVVDKFIFDEQIELLKYLNTHRSPRSETELHPFFEKWQKRADNNEYQFSAFLDFLLTQYGLIILTNKGYTISQLGVEYLSFIVRAGRPPLGETTTAIHKSGKDEV